MAIQMRRGKKADFDPTKMLPGEWAVSIDSDANYQIVWMCFAPGVVKRMGTYEDFKIQIREATEEIKDEYIKEFDSILKNMQELEKKTSDNTQIVITFKDDILNTYLPQIEKYVKQCEDSVISAAGSASSANNYAKESESYAHGNTGIRDGENTDNSKYYSDKSQASSQTAQSYAEQAEKAGDEAINRINEALAQNVPQFIVDLSTGHLMYKGGRFNFIVNEQTGHLLWEVII